MLRAMLIKVPALAGALLSLALLPWPASLGLAALALALAALALAAIVFDPNATFWAPTRHQARRATREVALTFDDGPDPVFTPRVLDLLDREGIQAAFFLVGERVEAHPALAAEIVARGHLVGNHSHRHGLDFHFKLWGGVADEIERCGRAIEAATGLRPRLFRSPQGFKNPALGDTLRRLGMVAVGWQARGVDSIERDPATITRRILDRVRPGGVILMHDGAGLGGSDDRGPTLAALAAVVEGLRARGLSPVRLDRLLDEPGYRASIQPGEPGA